MCHQYPESSGFSRLDAMLRTTVQKRELISIHGAGWWHDQRSKGLLTVVSLPSKRSIGPGKNTHQ